MRHGLEDPTYSFAPPMEVVEIGGHRGDRVGRSTMDRTELVTHALREFVFVYR